MEMRNPVVDNLGSSCSSFKQGACELVTEIGGDLKSQSNMMSKRGERIFEVQFVLNGSEVV